MYFKRAFDAKRFLVVNHKQTYSDQPEDGSHLISIYFFLLNIETSTVDMYMATTVVQLMGEK